MATDRISVSGRRLLLGLVLRGRPRRGQPLPAAAQRAQPCIGASWELTGPLAHTGMTIRIAVETALDEINAAGGVLGQPLRLVAYDDVGEPARAVDNARRIGERDNCIVMMGGFRTPNAIALRDPLAEMELPWMGVISAGTGVIEHPNNANKWMFRVSMKDRWVAPFLVDAAQGALARRARSRSCTRAPPGARARSLTSSVRWRAINMPLAGKETFNIADQDMSAQLIRLRDAGVDTIIFYGVDREATNMLRSMDRLGYKPTIISRLGHRRAVRPHRRAAGRRRSRRRHLHVDGRPAAACGRACCSASRRSSRRSRPPADIPLPSGTANAYDAIYIIAEAIKLAGRFDRDAFRQALFRVNYEGIVANYAPAFEPRQERHDAILPASYKLFAFHNGAMLPVEQTPFRQAAR